MFASVPELTHHARNPLLRRAVDVVAIPVLYLRTIKHLLLAPQGAGPSRSPIPSPLLIPALSMLPSDHWQSHPGSPVLTEAGSLRPEDSVSMASSQSSCAAIMLFQFTSGGAQCTDQFTAISADQYWTNLDNSTASNV